MINPNDKMFSILNQNDVRRLPEGWMRALFTEFGDEDNMSTIPKQSEHDMCPNCMESFHEWLLGRN